MFVQLYIILHICVSLHIYACIIIFALCSKFFQIPPARFYLFQDRKRWNIQHKEQQPVVLLVVLVFISRILNPEHECEGKTKQKDKTTGRKSG